MTNAHLKVKTQKLGSIWIYRVVNGIGQTVATRRGFATETQARSAGQAAAFVLMPRPVSQRQLRLEPNDRPALPKPVSQKQSFLRSLFG